MNSTIMNTTLIDMTETNMYLKDIFTIISYILISIVAIGGTVVLCVFVMGNIGIISRIVKSCCIRCDCCDGNCNEDDKTQDVEKQNTRIVVVLPNTKVMDAC